MALVSQNIIILFLGLVLGSFATALIYRVPRNIPWAFSADKTACRSACPDCKKLLTLRDLVPVFSWLINGGKCRHCKKPIDKIYPLTEILTVLACFGVFWSWGLTPASGILILCVPFLIALLVIDLQHMILPNQLVFIAGALALARLGVEIFYMHTMGPREDLKDYILGGILYGLFAWTLALIMTRVLKKEAMGFGDVKFFIVAGLWLGLMQLGWFCVLAGAIGIGIGMLWKLAGKGAVFPFGPALILSLYLLLVFPPVF